MFQQSRRDAPSRKDITQRKITKRESFNGFMEGFYHTKKAGI